MKEVKSKQMRIALFGHFCQHNFGNESTLQAILYHLRRRIPNAEVTCICTGPEVTAAAYNIAATPIRAFKSWESHNPLMQLLRKVLIGIPREVCRWFMAFGILMRTDMFIIPGTGLLTDAYGLMSWGPYNLFRWSLTAKLCRCKLLFVSVGAGPISGVLGRFFVKSALSCADFRSYRDDFTMEYVKRMGIATNGDRVYPDLAFSLPEADMPHDESPKRHRRVIGVGVMHHSSMYGPEGPSDAMYLAYLDKLVVLVQWLLTHEYDVRLLIGDKSDTFVTEKFVSLLRERLPAGYEGRIFNEPVDSVEQLVSQLAATDIVVATRFHNVLLALLLNKPVISISFHSKCSSLMSSIGLSEYCHDINHLSAGELIQQFCDIEKDAAKLELFIRQRTEEFRRELDEQYGAIFKEGLREPCDGRRSPRDLPPAIGFHEGI